MGIITNSWFDFLWVRVRAAVVKVAYDNRQGSSEIEDILLRCKVDDLCAACEALRGRKYLRNSIKCVEIEGA